MNTGNTRMLFEEMINRIGGFAELAQQNFTRMELEQFGYETISTFWKDLTIAEYFGEKGIRDTYNNVKKEWCNDTKMFTEFIMCLNHKCWAWYEKNEDISKLYADLYYAAHDWVHDNWDEEQLDYYFRITD